MKTKFQSILENNEVYKETAVIADTVSRSFIVSPMNDEMGMLFHTNAPNMIRLTGMDSSATASRISVCSGARLLDMVLGNGIVISIESFSSVLHGSALHNVFAGDKFNPFSQSTRIYVLGTRERRMSDGQSSTENLLEYKDVPTDWLLAQIGKTSAYNRDFPSVLKGLFGSHKQFVLWLAKKYTPGGSFGELMKMFGYTDKEKAMSHFVGIVDALRYDNRNLGELLIFNAEGKHEHGNMLRAFFKDKEAESTVSADDTGVITEGTVFDFNIPGAVPIMKNGENWIVHFDNWAGGLVPWYKKHIVGQHKGYWCIGASKKYFDEYKNSLHMITLFMDGELYQIVADNNGSEFQDWRNENNARAIIFGKAMKIFGTGFGKKLIEQYDMKVSKFPWIVSDAKYNAIPLSDKGLALRNVADAVPIGVVMDAIEMLKGAKVAMGHGMVEYAKIFRNIRSGADDRFMRYFTKNENTLSKRMFENSIEADKYGDALSMYMVKVSPFVRRDYEVPRMREFLNGVLSGTIDLDFRKIVVPTTLSDLIVEKFNAAPSRELVTLYLSAAMHTTACGLHGKNLFLNHTYAKNVNSSMVNCLEKEDRHVSYMEHASPTESEGEIDAFNDAEDAVRRIIEHGLNPGLLEMPEFETVIKYKSTTVAVEYDDGRYIYAGPYIFSLLFNNFLVSELRPDGKTAFRL